MIENQVHYFILYILRDGNTNNYKIGKTNNLKRRMKELQTGCPHKLEVIKLWKHTRKDKIARYERVLQNYYTKYSKHTKGEWFELTEEDITTLKIPETIAEQNKMVEDMLIMM